MIVVNNIGKTDDYVYDISLDGTVVNALGLNVLSNTDGFNFQKPLKYRYTESHPYIGKGLGRNVKKGKEYTEVDADVEEDYIPRLESDQTYLQAQDKRCHIHPL